MVLDTSLLNTQHYKVRIKGNSGAFLGKELCPPLHLGVVAIEKGAFGSPLTTVANLLYTGWIVSLLFFYNDGFSIKYFTKVECH